MPDQQARPQLATAIAVALIAAGLVGLALSDLGDLFTPLAGILAGCTIVAELIGARYTAQLRITAAFAANMLAAGFLGPAPAFVLPVLSYLAVWLLERYRWRALLNNIAGTATPTMR
jgi:Na+/glutamate symporter